MSIGVSVSDDLVVIAVVDVSYEHNTFRREETYGAYCAVPVRMRIFAKHDLAVLKPCPFYNDWAKHITIVDGKINWQRAVQDIMEEQNEEWFAYDPDEIQADEHGVPITKSEYEPLYRPELEHKYFNDSSILFSSLSEAASKDQHSWESLVMYFVRAQGKGIDRTEIIRAICLASVAPSIRYDREQNKMRVEEEAKKHTPEYLASLEEARLHEEQERQKEAERKKERIKQIEEEIVAGAAACRKAYEEEQARLARDEALRRDTVKVKIRATGQIKELPRFVANSLVNNLKAATFV